MSDLPKVKPGEPDCICQGTGLVCSLTLEDGKTVADPTTIAVCDCVLKRVVREGKLREAVQVELTHGGVADEMAQVATTLGGRPNDLSLLGRRLDTARDAFRERMEEVLNA